MPDAETTIAERLVILVAMYAGGTKAAFARRIGITAQGVGDLLKGTKGGPSFQVLQNILTALPNVQPEWLLFGKTPMLRDPAETAGMTHTDFINHQPSLQQELDELLKPEGRKNLPPLTVAVDMDGNDTIMLVDSPAKAGYISHHLEPEYIGQLPAMRLPLPEFRNGTYRAFRVEGHSMSPTLHDGSVVLCRFVDLEMDKIKSTYVHVVVTHEGIVTKRVITNVDASSTLTLRSDNKEFTSYPVNMRDVQELWCVVASLNFQMPAPRKNPTKQLYSFELEEMRNRLEILWKNYTGQ
ncbi:S24 family peptidase [Hymenobacter sp. UYP22]|uniref:XRE family transcriptional regulator n=1 Tax=Hymenobacter sp. UYP22 TaxID=3156348 RepID=UPI00339253E6